MKLRHKIFASALPLITTAPIMLAATGCNNSAFDKLINSMHQQILDEYNKISKIYRPTYGTELISTYISQQIARQGLACYDDYDIMLDHAAEWEKPDGHQNGNLMIKLPATSGCEKWPVVGLQAHMDMVCDGFTGGPITLVTDGDVIHSKDWKTSIGADNGIGLATILTIIKNRNNFVHGPIRCFITVDEEDGEGGAHWMQDEWLENIKYFINMDHEDQNSVCINCAGVQQTKVDLPCTVASQLTDYPIHYCLKVYGVNGGASGFALENNPIFAIKTAFDILKGTKAKFSESEQFVISSIVTDEVESNGGGSISKNITINFSTPDTVTPSNFLTYAREIYISTMAAHPSETDFRMSLTTTDAPTQAIDPDLTNLLINLFSEKKLYGDISTSVGDITKCSNVGPISTNYVSSENIIHVSFETFGRCSVKDELGPNPDKTRTIESLNKDEDGMLFYYKDLIDNAVSAAHQTRGIVLDSTKTLNDKDAWFKSIGWNPCWQGKEISKATDIYMNYAKSKGVTMSEFKALGWCESAEFINKVNEAYPTQNFQMSCVGPTIVDGHTRNGYVLSSSIRALVDRVVYTLTQLKD